jgi:RNase H-like domain found in reverse transcriptase/Reverse transcriptase (RNA-dependent DNA polymerase)/Integrase zinc binding domain
MPLYSMSRDELLVLRKTLTELLDQGFIRASHSAAAAPVIFVKKPGGGLRFCVDYRGLNAITLKDRYPLPLINETLRQIAGCRYISKVDVISAFYRLRIKENDEWKTAFTTRLGCFEWLVTPFGLSGAPASFQRYINHILREDLDICCSAYLDDVIIYSNRSQEDHRRLVLKILRKLGLAGLQLDWEKSEFEAKEITYLGFVIEAGKGIKAHPDKIKAILQWEAPKTLRGIRGFLGFTNYYRQFVPNYSEIALPLTALTRKDNPYIWTDNCQKAFDTLRKKLIAAPLLIAWNPEAPTMVETDSSGYAIGGVLSQQENLIWQPVAYFSRKLTPAESNYPIHDKEMLAIVACLKEWRAELQGRPFEVRSDHKNLEYFRNRRQLGERQLRWAYDLSNFTFTINHKPGTEQILSDALSRRDQDLPQDHNDDRLASRNQILLEEGPEASLKIKAGWISNSDQGDTEEPLSESELFNPPKSPFSDQELSDLWKISLENNSRYWKIRQAIRNEDRSFPIAWGLPISISECSIDIDNRLRWRDRIWIPAYEPLRTKVIQQIHDSPLAGHPGREATRDLVAREYTWLGLSQDIRRFIRNCQTCGKAKVWREQKKGLLKPLPIPNRPWEEISMDFITDLPENTEGFTTILVVTDRLSKSLVFIPMKTTTSQEVARIMLERVFSFHGLPKAIVSDRGPQFTSLF